MNIFKKIIMGLFAVLVLLALIGLVLPSSYKISRSISIQAPSDVVFDQVNDLAKNEAWSPWKEKDPTMKITLGAITAGKGASTSWTSKKMGEGSQTIAESVPNRSIKLDLDFKGMGTAAAFFDFVAEGEAVKVTQSMTSDAGMNPVRRWFNLFADKMMGPIFEKGLTNLKQVSEVRAAALKVEQAATQQATITEPTDAEEARATKAAPTKAH